MQASTAPSCVSDGNVRICNAPRARALYSIVTRQGLPRMSEDAPTNRTGMIKELFGALPPLARSILMWMLVFPIAVSISGMLLQVNVGALIQDSLKQSRGQTVDLVGEMLRERLTKLDSKIDDIQEAIQGQTLKYADLDKRLSLVEREQELLRRQVQQ